MADRILNGVTAETFNYLQLGAGAIIRNFQYGNITTVSAFQDAYRAALQTPDNLGGTRGGIGINIVPTTRKVEIDGTEMVSFVGEKIVESWDISMSASLVQFNPQSMREAFPSSEFKSIGTGVTEMIIKQQFSNDDYAQNHTWISSTKYGWLMISYQNTLSMLNGEITSNSSGEAVVPVIIHPHNADFLDIENLPVVIWFIDRTGNTITINTVKNLIK